MRRAAGGVAMLVTLGALATPIASCERVPAARTARCEYSRADTLALARAARDTIARLKGRPQQVTEITSPGGGIAFRTEDTDSSAFHNGGAVSFDCAKRVTEVWLDGG